MGKPLFTFDERRLEAGRDRNTVYVTAIAVDSQDGKSLMDSNNSYVSLIDRSLAIKLYNLFCFYNAMRGYRQSLMTAEWLHRLQRLRYNDL